MTVKNILPSWHEFRWDRMTLDGIDKIARHDVKIFMRMLSGAFSRGRDKLLLLCIAPFALAAAKNGFDTARDALRSSGERGLLLWQVALALAAVLATRSRMNWHRDNGILGAIALRPEALATYCIIGLALGFMLTLAITGIAPGTIATIAVGLLSAAIEVLLLGALSARLLPKITKLVGNYRIRRSTELGVTLRSRTWNLIAELICLPRIGFAGNTIALSLAGFVLGSALVIARPANNGLSALAFVAILLACLIALSILLRLPHSVARFLIATGTSPFEISIVITILSVALFAPMAICSLIGPATFDRATILLVFGLVVAVIAAVSLLQAAHYALRPRQAANTAIQIELAALAVTGGLIGPAVIAPLLVRLVLLRRSVMHRKLIME